MIPRALIILAALSSASAPAQALTGAEVLDATPLYARGVIWGTTEALLYLGMTTEAKALSHFRFECLEQAKATDNTMFLAVTAYIKRNPDTLTYPVVVAVHRTLFEMCGVPPK